MNRNQIIIISVLGITALLIGYFKNPLNLSMGKQAEVQGPVPPTIVTNVITNLSNIIVTNIITNTVPIKPQPNPVKPKSISEKDIVGTYGLKRSTSVIIDLATDLPIGANPHRLVFLDNGIQEGYVDGRKQNTDIKWSLVDNEIHIVAQEFQKAYYRINPDNSITAIANIFNGKRYDFPK